MQSAIAHKMLVQLGPATVEREDMHAGVYRLQIATAVAPAPKKGVHEHA